MKHVGRGGSLHVDCAVCGKYLLNKLAINVEPHAEIKPQMYLLSALIRRKDSDVALFEVSASLMGDPAVFQKMVLLQTPASIRGKSDALLRTIADRSYHPGAYVCLDLELDYPLAYSRSESEFSYYLDHLSGLGLLLQHSDSSSESDLPVSVTPEGWDYLDGLSRTANKPNQCFVIMWFDDCMTEAFLEGIKPLEESAGYSMLRVDQTEFNGKICDQILAEIRKSRFVIADVTGHRQAVYFEAGFAMGLGIPVIWSCRKDALSKCENFDTRQYNHIVWETPDELCIKLAARIGATVGCC